mmetsp:Transcript_93320/g.216971  ORF Transcript_93320/g.216971 Transcript_93320/m.216971 type:complete len:398 (+) Transcript_93320:409-1602(+)
MPPLALQLLRLALKLRLRRLRAAGDLSHSALLRLLGRDELLQPGGLVLDLENLACQLAHFALGHVALFRGLRPLALLLRGCRLQLLPLLLGCGDLLREARLQRLGLAHLLLQHAHSALHVDGSLFKQSLVTLRGQDLAAKLARLLLGGLPPLLHLVPGLLCQQKLFLQLNVLGLPPRHLLFKLQPLLLHLLQAALHLCLGCLVSLRGLCKRSHALVPLGKQLLQPGDFRLQRLALLVELLLVGLPLGYARAQLCTLLLHLGGLALQLQPFAFCRLHALAQLARDRGKVINARRDGCILLLDGCNLPSEKAQFALHEVPLLLEPCLLGLLLRGALLQLRNLPRRGLLPLHSRVALSQQLHRHLLHLRLQLDLCELELITCLSIRLLHYTDLVSELVHL